MVTHQQTDLGHRKRTGPNGSAMPPTPGNSYPPDTLSERLGSRERSEESPLARPTQRAPEAEPVPTGNTQESSRPTFGIEEIHTIAFRCGVCRTEVRFPRIRWASSPECCPNCGARWMSQPSQQEGWTEDVSTYVFRVILAFREALQALAGMERTAVFTLALEMNECPDHAKAGPATTGKFGK